MFEHRFVTQSQIVCYNGSMTDVDSKADKPARAHRFKLLDVIVTVVIVLIIGALAYTLLSQLRLKHEVAAARAVSDQMITAIHNTDASSARKLGDKTFQQQNSTTSLTAQFEAVDTYTAKATAVSDKTTVTNENGVQAVSVVYKYSSKKPFYVRVIVTKPKGASSWHVVDISGNIKESPLLNNKY